MAVCHLQAFYDRKASPFQVTEVAKTSLAPPPGFRPYVKAGDGGFVAMINHIIADRMLASGTLRR